MSTRSSDLLAFPDAPGWYATSPQLPSGLHDNNQVVWIANFPLPDRALGAWPREVTPTLAERGTVLLASLACQVDDPETYQQRTLPLRVSDGYIHEGRYEGQPAAHVSLFLLTSRVKDQFLFVEGWFGANRPASTELFAADALLGSLLIPDPGWAARSAEGELGR